MNGPKSILLHDYKAPQLEPLLSVKSFGYYLLNICTVGIHGSASKLSQQHRVKELNIVQGELKDQIADLNQEWEALENNLGDLSEQVMQLNGQDDDQLKLCQDRLAQIADKNKTLNCKEIGVDHPTVKTIASIALGTIAFLGQLLANVCTLFLYGVYVNNSLRNQVTELEHINASLRQQYDAEKNSRFARIDKIVEGLSDSAKEKYAFLNLQTENEEIKKTDQGKAYIDLQQASQKVTDLEAKQTKLEADVTALRVQKVQAEQAKKKVEDDLANAGKELQQLHLVKKDYDQLKGTVAQKDTEIGRMQRNIDKMDSALFVAQQKASEVQRLDSELTKVNATIRHSTTIEKLAKELGPLPLQYTAVGTDGEMPGAMDLKDDDDQVDADWKAYASEYKTRYDNDKRSAAQIIEASFDYAFEHLIGLSGDDEDDDKVKLSRKIKLNRSMTTSATFGANAVYRYMAYDLLKGAKVTLNGCHGYALLVNENVEMLQSKPEKVLQYKDDQNGGYKPVVVVCHKQCDDFTPPVEAIGQNGVDPVSAKWILAQLTPEEEAHLLNMLLSPVIENKHPDYIQTRKFIEQKNARVQLVQTAFDLISDMGAAYAKKFIGTVLPKCWQEHVDTCDVDKKPFIKPEDDAFDVKPMKTVDWEFDADVIADRNPLTPWSYNPQFAALVASSQTKYQSFFKNLNQKIISAPAEKGKSYVKLSFEDVEKVYYLSHEMIGSKVAQQFGDQEYDLGGQHCLFSSLLTVFVSNTQDLTVENVHHMRRAMANYLDKLQQAKTDWAKLKKTLRKVPANDRDNEWDTVLLMMPVGSDKIRELALQASRFEAAIMKTHKCPIDYYQSWLRNEQVRVVADRLTRESHEVSTSSIKIDDLTPLEIELAAHTFGVRIGVLPILTESKTKTDDYGRIVPDGAFSEFFGPNTKEFLLMGATLMGGKPGTYYGIFPKIDTASTRGLEFADQNNLINLEAYWKRLNTKRNH